VRRRLIINADDFGLTSGVNRAIKAAHDAGIVSSATLMASGRQLDHAVQVARDSPKLSVGCHVVLVDGTPISDPRDIPSLMDRTDATRFRQSLSSFASSALAGRIDPAHVEAEATAQIRRLQAAGIKVSHLDTHKHSHVFPAVFMPLLGAARKCGI